MFRVIGRNYLTLSRPIIIWQCSLKLFSLASQIIIAIGNFIHIVETQRSIDSHSDYRTTVDRAVNNMEYSQEVHFYGDSESV